MSEFKFEPVSVNSGRKFRGNAYRIDGQVRVSSHTWAYTSFSERLWDPVAKTYVYASPECICNDNSRPDATVAADRIDYVKSIIDSTVKFCMSKTASAEDGYKFARACLVKHHPELIDHINAALPDNRNLADEIEHTLAWACDLKTRPMWLYGKFCPGGKPYSPKRIAVIAKKSLMKKFLHKLDGFDEAWKAAAIAKNLPWNV